MKQQVDDRRRRDTQPLRRTAIVLPLAAQQAGAQNIEPVEAELRQLALHLALHPQVEVFRKRVRADRADMDETLDAEVFRGARRIEHQILIDSPKRGFVLARLLPGRAQCADDRPWTHGLDHFTPFGGFGHEHLHADTARQPGFTPGDARQPHVLAPDTLFDHGETDQPRRADQADADCIRHCSIPRARVRRSFGTGRWHSDRSCRR